MDLELKELEQYNGTEGYGSLKPISPVKTTDGIAYIMENGYSWFITDMLVIVEMKGLRREEFLAIKLKINGGKAVATIEDGNNKVFYKQKYDWTNCKRNITLFLTDDVLLLSGEY